LTAQALDIRDTAAGFMSSLGAEATDHCHDPLAYRDSPARENRMIELVGAAPVETPTDAARSLLTRIVARLPGRGPKIVQFLSFDPTPASDVSRALCVAAAYHLGHVLLAEIVAPDTDAGVEGIFPDAAVARLYHRRLSLCPLDVVRHGRAALLRAIDAGNDVFDMVVFDSRYTDNGLGNTLLASAFAGTVLVARAGSTTLPQLSHAASAVQEAGGLLLGAVLADAPPTPSWLRRLGAR
jgi:hypothetical protein